VNDLVAYIFDLAFENNEIIGIIIGPGIRFQGYTKVQRFVDPSLNPVETEVTIAVNQGVEENRFIILLGMGQRSLL